MWWLLLKKERSISEELCCSVHVASSFLFLLFYLSLVILLFVSLVAGFVI